MHDWNKYIRDHLSPLGLKPERELEIIEELAQHLEGVYEDAVASGLSSEDALARAVAIIHDWQVLECELAREERPIAGERLMEKGASQGPHQRGDWLMRSILEDLRYGWRMLRKNKVSTTAAALSLALGIGANTAIFGLINAILLMTLPVRSPEQLVLLTINDQGSIGEYFPYPFYEQFRDRTQSFSGVLASGGERSLRMAVNESEGSGETESVRAEGVSGNYFSVLGVNAVHGRALSAEDDRKGNPQPVVMISHGFWERRFGLDPEVVGKTIRLNHVSFTIIGTAPQGFTGIEVGRNPDLWHPLQMTPQIFPGSRILEAKSSWWLHLMGRMRPGATEAQARAELGLLFQPLLAEMAEAQTARLGSRWSSSDRRALLERRIELQPGGTGWTRLRKQFRSPLFILFLAAGLTLAIACANVANLLLARAGSRRKEIAMRLALGAGRSRLIRQLLTESLLLAIISGLLGLVFAKWGARSLLAYLPGEGISLKLDLNYRILGFSIAVSGLTGILFGLAPALRATRLDLVSMLKDEIDPSSRRWSRFSQNKTLVVAQVALSLFLLVGAGLFVRSLQKLKGQDAGFDRDHVLLFSVDTDYDADRRASLYQRLLDRLEALPGVQRASLSSHGLLSDTWNDLVSVEGYTPRPEEDLLCYGQVVAPKYFETMGTPILLGRDISSQDSRPIGADIHQTPPRIALINQTMAQYFFPNESPIGKRFSVGRPDQMIEIIGVVKDTKYESLREDSLRIFYLPFFQGSSKLDTTFEVRTLGPPSALVEAIRRVVQELDPSVPILRMRTLNDLVDATLMQERLVAQLTGFFSLFALLLSAIGLYGVMSYAVTRRTKEIGVRMALGAREADVMWMMLRETLLLVGIGTAIGLVGALAATRLIESLLFGLTPKDPITIAGAILLLGFVAALAGYLPARRAARVDPMVALRVE